MRIHATVPTNVTPGTAPFISPTGIDHWRSFVASALPDDPKYSDFKRNLEANIGHRLQYLEFLVAMLAHDKERRAAGDPSSLHETVKRQKIQQHCIIANSIFEGIGAYEWRRQSIIPYALSKTVKTRQWINALCETVRRRRLESAAYKAQCIVDVTYINNLRSEIHIDTLVHGEIIHFNTFDESVFVRTHGTLKKILESFSPTSPITSSTVFEAL